MRPPHWNREETPFVHVYIGSTNPQNADKVVGMCKRSLIDRRLAELEAAGTPYCVNRYHGISYGYVPWKKYEGRAN